MIEDEQYYMVYSQIGFNDPKFLYVQKCNSINILTKTIQLRTQLINHVGISNSILRAYYGAKRTLDHTHSIYIID